MPNLDAKGEKMRLMILAASAALLAGCSDDSATAPKAKEAPAASLEAGEYEITAKIDNVRSVDKASPKTASKAGDAPKVTRTCVPADGTLEPAVFAEAGESCSPLDNYMRGGRMSLQFKCRRGRDQLTQLVDGDFKADSFEATVRTATYFSGDGDYELVRTFTAKRVGECSAVGSDSKG